MVQANLIKMTPIPDNPVQYYLNLGNESVHVNELLGRKIHMHYLHRINCIKCGRLTKTSFAQGYCYPCFTTAPETGDCILRPELCQAHEGISRDMKWSEEHCLQDHFVYLALSSGVKVGVTRSSQIPTRWIDQGAWKAIRLARTPNRYLAGRIEVALKAHMSDKTNWRRMLSNQLAQNIDLKEEKEKASGLLDEELASYIVPDNQVTEIPYPVLQYPEKVTSLGFDKTKFIDGILTGIKGQYLMFDDGSVLNIRKHGGYLVAMNHG